MSFSVVIVEDETILRQGIVRLPPWQKIGCTVVGDFSNAIAALEFIENNPTDIVITDIVMPKMSGLELCKAVKSRFPKTKVIVLTAFEEFSYAQEALRFGASDYIIKADFLKRLPESIERVTAQLSVQEQGNFDKQLTSLILESVLSGNVVNLHLIESLSKSLCIDLNNCYVTVSEIIGEAEDVDVKRMEQLYELVLHPYPHIFFWAEENVLVTLIARIPSQQILQELFRECIVSVSHLSHNSVQIGISSMSLSLDDLSHQYQAALDALSVCSVPNSLSLCPEQFDRAASLQAQNLFRQMLHTLKTEYETESLPALMQSVARLFSCETESLSFSTLLHGVQYLSMEFVFSSSLQSGSKSKNFIDNILKNYQTCHSRYSLQLQFEQFIHESLHTSADTGKNSVVSQVNQYIHENYMQPFKLEALAAYVHMNSSYLSRTFKKLTGESVVTALNQYRVRVAKKLLLSGLLIKDTALQVGIPDPAYFTVVFTKHAGISPKEYQLSNKN